MNHQTEFQLCGVDVGQKRPMPVLSHVLGNLRHWIIDARGLGAITINPVLPRILSARFDSQFSSQRRLEK